MCMPASEHTQHMSDAHHKLGLGLGLLYYMCGVRTGTVDTYVYTTKCISFGDGQLLIVFCYWQNIWACPH